MATDNPYPVFVVGSPRSGTTIFAQAMQRAGYHGFIEGHVLGLLGRLRRISDDYFQRFWTDDPFMMISRIDREEFKAGLGDLFKRLVERENPVPPWFDKSPNLEVISLIPVLFELWPSSRFIFAKRRALENIASRLKKFPGFDFEYHCRDWATSMAEWRAIKLAMPDLPCIEVDQQDMIRNPAATTAQIGDFLNFSEQQRSRFMAAYRKERPQQTGVGTTERVLTLASASWSPQHVALFMKHCKPEMDRYGYTLDQTYNTPQPG